MDAVPSVEDVLGRVAMFAGRVGRRTARCRAGSATTSGSSTAAGARTCCGCWTRPCPRPDWASRPSRRSPTRCAAAETGVGARVFEVLPDVPALVLEYLPGRTLGAADVRTPATISPHRRGLPPAARRPAVRQRLLHRRQAARAAATSARRHDLPCRTGYDDRLAAVDDIDAALAAAPLPAVPCHNDLLAENFIDSGGVDPHRRLPALRQQRPVLRARRHRGRVRLRPRPGRAARRRRTSAPSAAERCWPGCG